MESLASVMRELRSCAETANNGPVTKLSLDLDLVLTEIDGLSSTAFGALVELIRDPDFRRLDDAWRVVQVFRYNWDILSREQRDALVAILVDDFDKFGNWMGAFVIAEVLGEVCADARALKSLQSLGAGAMMPARAFVASGLRLLVENAEDAPIKDAALEELRRLSSDADKSVRDEARVELSRLSRRSQE
jgi:hypothetical protein